MSKSILFFCILIFLFGCANDPDKSSSKTTEIIPEAASFFPLDLVEKANVQVEIINQLAFESVTYLDTLKSIADLCYLSKGYQSQVWEGLNRCDWAIEKDRIKEAGSLVKRERENLLILTESNPIEFINQTNQYGDSVYYQYKKYLPDSGFFIVEKNEASDCDKTLLIQSKNNSEYSLKGNIDFLKNPTHFILSSSSFTNPKCPNKLEYYEIQDSLLVKQWHLPLKSKSIEKLKVGNDNNLYCAISEKNKAGASTSYLKIDLMK